MKLHNEEYLRANIISSVTLITGRIYFISSWSVSSFINHFQFGSSSAYTKIVLYMYYYGILNSCVKK